MYQWLSFLFLIDAVLFQTPLSRYWRTRFRTLWTERKEVPKKGGMGATLSGPGYFAYVNVIALYPKFPIIFSFKVCIIEGNMLVWIGAFGLGMVQ